MCAVTLLVSGCAQFKDDYAAEPIVTKSGDYAAQKLDWQKCPVSGGEVDAECAYVEAPLDWQKPESDKAIKLHLAMLPAKSDNPVGTVFVNPGGPGASGSEFVIGAAGIFDELRKTYNVIGWAPRGVKPSSPVTCYTDSELDDSLYGYDPDAPEAGTQEWLDKTREENQQLGERCEELSGELYKHVGTRNTVQDLELLRQLVGDERLNYLGFSYGTYIGARYAQMFPQTAGKLVLDGAVDPTADINEVITAQSKGFELALRNYWQDCVAHGCYAGDSVDAGMNLVSELLAKVKNNPIKAEDGRWLTDSVLLIAIAAPLYSHEQWPRLDELFQSVQAGKPETALELADQYYNRIEGQYLDNSTTAFMTINCADYPESQPNLAEMRADAQRLAEAAPVLGPYQGYGAASCWGWPVPGDPQGTDPVHGKGAGPVLVVGTVGDPATPYQWAKNLADQLETGHLITYNGEGHTAYGQSQCVTKHVNDFFNGAEAAEATCDN